MAVFPEIWFQIYQQQQPCKASRLHKVQAFLPHLSKNLVSQSKSIGLFGVSQPTIEANLHVCYLQFPISIGCNIPFHAFSASPYVFASKQTVGSENALPQKGDAILGSCNVAFVGMQEQTIVLLQKRTNLLFDFLQISFVIVDWAHEWWMAEKPEMKMLNSGGFQNPPLLSKSKSELWQEKVIGSFGATKTVVVVTVIRIVPVSIRRAAVVWFVVPRPATKHTNATR